MHTKHVETAGCRWEKINLDTEATSVTGIWALLMIVQRESSVSLYCFVEGHMSNLNLGKPFFTLHKEKPQEPYKHRIASYDYGM